MARYVKPIIEMTQSQTKEFIASLTNPKHEKEKAAILKEVASKKFNVVL